MQQQSIVTNRLVIPCPLGQGRGLLGQNTGLKRQIRFICEERKTTAPTLVAPIPTDTIERLINPFFRQLGAFSASGKPASFRFRYSLIPAGLSKDSLQSALPLRRPGARNGVSLESGNHGKLLFVARSAKDALLAVGGLLRSGLGNHAAKRGRPATKTAALWLPVTTRETPSPSRAGGAYLCSGNLKVGIVSNHPNRGWRSRWSFDVGRSVASHWSGWEFSFKNTEGVLHYECIKRPQVEAAKFERIAQEALTIYREAFGR